MTPVEDRLVPPAGHLPDGVVRHAPTPEQLRDAVRALSPGSAGDLPWPDLLDALVAVGRTDVPIARLVEAHVDALRIHHQAGSRPVPDAVYAVWASRSHATGIRATGRPDGRLRLDGTLRFTSGSGIVDRALVPVWVSPEQHLLLDLPVDTWAFDTDAWRTRAMAPTRTGAVAIDGLVVDDDPVGAPGSYLARPGFFAGGVGVAAVWAGAAARVLDLVVAATPAERRTESQRVRLGRMWTEVAAAVAVLRDASARLDAPAEEVELVATTVRAAVAGGVRRVLTDARVVAGPAGLALDEDLTRAIDDTALFVAQQHEDADAGRLGERR